MEYMIIAPALLFGAIWNLSVLSVVHLLIGSPIVAGHALWTRRKATR